MTGSNNHRAKAVISPEGKIYGSIKEASKECHGILGIHLEGIFLNPLKKGIHNIEHFLALTVENYQKEADNLNEL